MKLRPAFLIGKLPGGHEDWLICMISTQLAQTITDFDEIVLQSDADFAASGLKTDSLIRIGRLAVVQSAILSGAVGQIAPERLQKIKSRLSAWLLKS